ncbi:L10-interacting MYB domain-containing protein-like isoform X2 [Quercus robur]|uniref:L10-interacting MYB domain-containing protein-like isoform X2 n=1 Tax=Quercus robur TaxID=38942 RepID=UPI002161C42C|nr:L10-interacting MYB domain-containing protein-like isoform X2 [Quercus robur]
MGKKTTSNSEVKKARADWDINPTWTTTFCNICVEQIQAGNRTKGAGFSTKGWVNLVTKFCNETGLNYDKDQLKSRWDVLKGDWRVWERLKNLDTGLGWDAEKGTIAAPDEWWDLKLKELPKAKKFREKGPQNLEQLDIMFRDVAATGVAAWTPSSNTLPPTMPEEGAGDSDGSSEFKDNQCDMSLDIDSLQQGQTSQSRSSGQKRTSVSIPSQKKKKKIGGAAMLDDRMCQLITACQNRSEGTSRESPSSIDNVMTIVRALPGVESSFVVQASYILLKKSRREMFLTFKDPEVQLEWLQGMIYNQKK